MANNIFVSPGVYTSEKDITFVTKQVGVTTLGLVGETTKGPAFNPVFVSDYDEFKTFFGGLNTAKIADTGAPKYELPYIAKSYLSESNQLFVTRVLGLSGYDAGKTWGITIDGALDNTTTGNTAPISITTDFLHYTGDTYGNVTDLFSTAPLMAFLSTGDDLKSALKYVEDKAPGMTGNVSTIVWGKDNASSNFSGVTFNYTVLSTGTTLGGLPTGHLSGSSVVYYSGVSYADVDNMVVATLRSRGRYDGDENLEFECSGAIDVIIDSSVNDVETNPMASFRLSANTKSNGASVYDISFDSTKKDYISRVLGRTQTDGKPALFVDEIYKNMLDDYITAGKVRGINLSLVNYSDKFKNYKAEYAPAVTPYIMSEVRGSDIIKLFRLWTISDGNSANSEIKVSIENVKPDDKEFDVVIRNYADTDTKPSKLEVFSRCTMDRSADNFVGRKIGTLDGEFATKSNYVLVELADESDFDDAFPAGFLGFPRHDFDSTALSQGPQITYKTTYDQFENKRKSYLGLNDGIGFDQSFFNYKGIPLTGLTESNTTYGFHMDSGATLTETIYDFNTGNAQFRTDSGIRNTDYEDIKARKFTLSFYGGFDGWDIYRTRRTNTDYYTRNKYKGDITPGSGVFKEIDLTNGEKGLNTDYYAYLEAIRTFSNPEAVNINVFATPGIDTTDNDSLINDAIEMIETERADSLYIITVPDTANGDIRTADDVVGDLEGKFDSNYTCTYWPWVQINDPENNQYMWVPPTRDVVRNIARTDNVSYPWFAVGGTSRGQVDCIKARKKLTLGERDTLYDSRVNPIATFTSDGVCIWGNKTLQVADTALNRINVRRLLLQTRKLISAVAIRLLFDQNDDIVRNQFLSLVNPILDGIRSERGLTDFRVTVDSSPESIDRNELIGKIFIKPTRSLEYIDISFTIFPTGASFDDI